MLKHILIRLGILFIVPIFVDMLRVPDGTTGGGDNGMGQAFADIVVSFVSTVLLIIIFLVDTIILYRKKQRGKVIYNIAFLMFILLVGMFR